MAHEVLAKMALGVSYDIYRVLGTRLPRPWDFVRIDLRIPEKLALNIGSYYGTYFLFLFWFFKFAMKEMDTFIDNHLHFRHWYFLTLLAFATSTQILWPLLLLSTHFVFCTYYPWVVAALVLYLNSPRFSALYLDSCFSWDLFVEAVYHSPLFVDSQLRALFDYFDDDEDADDQPTEDSIDDESSRIAESRLSEDSFDDQHPPSRPRQHPGILESVWQAVASITFGLFDHSSSGLSAGRETDESTPVEEDDLSTRAGGRQMEDQDDQSQSSRTQESPGVLESVWEAIPSVASSVLDLGGSSDGQEAFESATVDVVSEDELSTGARSQPADDRNDQTDVVQSSRPRSGSRGRESPKGLGVTSGVGKPIGRQKKVERERIGVTG